MTVEIHLEELAEFLNTLLKSEQFVDDPNGIYQHSSNAIRRIGLLLEPWSGLEKWVCSNQIDALFCHRPWRLQLDQLPPEMGILAYHLAFDEGLTVGYNPNLANSLEITNLAVLGTKLERPIGMIGDIKTQSLSEYVCHIKTVFGGIEEARLNSGQVSRVAVVGAMSPDLIQSAADRQAELYITGQLRRSAELAVQATGISVIAVGHERSEQWGMQTLANLLRQRWPDLDVVLPDSLSHS